MEPVEDLARASDLRFRALVDAATDAIVCSDTHGRVTYFNKAAERTFGYAAVEIVGRSITEIMPGRYREAHRHGFKKYLETGEARYIGKTIELVGRRKDGSEFALELSLTSLPNRYRDGSFVGFIRDISGRRRSEEALKLAQSKLEAQLEKRWRSRAGIAADERVRQIGDRQHVEKLCRLVVESAPNSTVVVDESGEIVLVNRQTEALFGYDRTELIGAPVEMLIPGALRDKHREYRAGFYAAPRSRAMGSDRNLKGLRKDGVEVPVEIGLNVITVPDGLLVVSTIIDISERRRFEKAQEFLLRELDHRVKNTLATVQSLAEQTCKSSASLNEFEKSFGERISALARIHGALSRRNWVGLSLRQLIEMMVAPFNDECGSRVLLEGEALAVSLRSIRPLGMAIHELTTNAVKHGALSVAEGRVRVSWREDESAVGPNRLVIEWSESGGPPVVRPSHRGAGMKLIEEGVPYELGGQAQLRFPTTGACCDINVPYPNPHG